MPKLTKIAVTALLGSQVVLWPALTRAQPETGAYIGGALGQVTHVDGCDGVPSGISCDDSDTGWKIFGGYQFNPNFAVELAYSDLGETRLSDPFDSATIRPKAWEVVAVGTFPVQQRFSLYGKLGFYRATTKLDTTFGITDEDSNTDLTFALGARYDINRNLALRGEWQRYADVGGDDLGTSDIDLFSIGLIWKF